MMTMVALLLCFFLLTALIGNVVVAAATAPLMRSSHPRIHPKFLHAQKPQWPTTVGGPEEERGLNDEFGTLTTMGGPDYPINGVDVKYVDVEGTSLLGYLSLPAPAAKSTSVNNATTTTAANGGKLPAVIVIHGQDGISMYEKQRASILSSSTEELGYVGFAADIYGIDAILPPPDADFMAKGVFTSTYTTNVTLFTQRIQAAIDYVSSLDEVDENKVAIIGYCFGGIGVVHYLNTRGGGSSSSSSSRSTDVILVMHGLIDLQIQQRSSVDAMATRTSSWSMNVVDLAMGTLVVLLAMIK